MPIDAELIEILRCPATHRPVRPADEALVARVNAAIAAGTLRDVGGQPVSEPIDEALVRDDDELLYVVRDEIPEMLIDGAIRLADLGD